MAKPKRTFTGQEGQRSTGTAGPDALRHDLDNAFAMFDPSATTKDGQQGGIGEDNLKLGAATDDIIGERTVTDTTAPSSNTGKLTALLSAIANRIKSITGGSTWRSAPATTLADAKQHMDASAPHSGHALKSDLDAHLNDTDNPHEVTAAQIGAATSSDLASHVNNKSNPHGVTAKQVGAIASVAGISNAGGDVDIVGGTGITVSKDNTNKRVTITAQGGQAPAAHGSSHEQGGADPIPSLPTSGEKAALAGTYGTPSSTNKFVTDSDPRMTNARTPTAHKHSASDIDSGTISQDRLPKASTAGEGIVKLTTDRNSSSTELALAAKALYDHRTSNDHDDRYYTKAQIDDRYYTRAQIDALYYTKAQIDAKIPEQVWMKPGDTVLSSITGTASSGYDSRWNDLCVFIVKDGGMFRVTCEVKGNYEDDPEVSWSYSGYVRLAIAGTNIPLSSSKSGNSEDFVPVTLDMSIGVPAGTVISVQGQGYQGTASGPDGDISYSAQTYARNFQLRGIPGGNPVTGYFGGIA